MPAGRLLFLVLCIISYGVYFSEGFRQIWVQVLDGNLLTTMINLYMPTFLFIVVLLNAAPILLVTRKMEWKSWEIPAFTVKRLGKRQK